MKKKSTNKKKILVRLLLLVVAVACIVGLVINYEGEKPALDIELPMRTIGVSKPLTGTVSDRKSGLRTVWMALSQGGQDHVLLERSFPVRFYSRDDRVHEFPVDLLIEPQRLGLADGPALLRIRISDASFRGWFSGNVTYVEKELLIDTRPPEIDVLTRNHNIVPGGAALVIYKVSEMGGRTGVQVGDEFFPGHSGYFKDPQIMLAFFALTHTQGQNTPMFIEARDAAGNSARAGFMHYIGHKEYKADRINITDGFLNVNMPGFTVEGFTDNGNNLEKFLKINRDVRAENEARILSPGPRTSTEKYWEGLFLRLPGSATRAGFADRRSYYYNGKIVDHQYHLGIDLASVKHAPVLAANRGRVVLIDDIGIYGKTVVIDHGFGLFSTYSHLSRASVNEGDMVARGDSLGNTGITGLAGGDHLHYGMFVDHVFVDPLQWWDPSWIENNITSKLNGIEAGR